MKFETVSSNWLIEGAKNPKDVIETFVKGIIEYMPENSLGHIKGFVEFDGGRVFASSALIPPDINFTNEGLYSGGPINLYMTLIFGDVDQLILTSAMNNGEKLLRAGVECKLTKIIN
ncbi:MAG TPA: hypothetical protein QF720_08585 [Nitrospinota bacterium]|nr:hypothetical protein [Nitrospinota bacterium]|tara:strand:- start:49743 stop:50093 length:351 start_codon:yes stop_codon:yes gene_type:complete